MSSYQCHRWNLDAHVTHKHCLPDVNIIVEQTKRVLLESGLHKLLIATDQSAYTKEFRQALGDDYTIVHVDPWLPVIDAYLLSNARHFIGNCVSSFSSFVSRQRRYHSLGPTSYFAWENVIVE
jgi:peptide-O-fucosyltransferase